MFSHACTECPAGKINAAGDQAPFCDTNCVCTNTVSDWLETRSLTCNDIVDTDGMQYSCKRWQSDAQSGQPCRQSCFDVGAGYQGDNCAVENACVVEARGYMRTHAKFDRLIAMVNTAKANLKLRSTKCTCVFGTPAGAVKCVVNEENCMSCDAGYSLRRAKGAYSGRAVMICKKEMSCNI